VNTIANANFTPFRAAVAMGIFVLPFFHLREWLYFITLRPYLSVHKLKDTYTPENIYYFVKIPVLLVTSIGIGAYLGVLHFRVGGVLSTAAVLSFEYWAIGLIKDNVCLRLFHHWMHLPNMHWTHKTHHVSTRSMNLFNAYAVDYIDVIIENLCAVVIGVLLNKVLFGVAEMHLGTFFFLLWTDATIHSANPWGVSVFNPILDYYMKPTICHSLHHAEPSRPKHFTFYPWSHLWGTSMAQDVAEYNRLLGTHVTFDLSKSPEKIKS